MLYSLPIGIATKRSAKNIYKMPLAPTFLTNSIVIKNIKATNTIIQAVLELVSRRETKIDKTIAPWIIFCFSLPSVRIRTERTGRRQARRAP